MNLASWNEHSPNISPTPGVAATQAPYGSLCKSGQSPAGGPCASCEPLTTFPTVSVREDHELVHVLTELPGIDADELEISVEGTTLTLRGRRKEDSGMFRVDRCVQKFLCRIELSSAVDCARSQACLDMGVLSLTLPKLVSEPARTIKQSY